MGCARKADGGRGGRGLSPLQMELFLGMFKGFEGREGLGLSGALFPWGLVCGGSE